MVALTELTSFARFLLLVIPLENGIGTFLGFYSTFQSEMGELILESISHTSQGKRKCPMISFRLDLVKQLINGFSQRKRKRRSQEAQNHSVAREEHKSVHIKGRKRKCVQCIKAGRRTPKGYKVR